MEPSRPLTRGISFRGYAENLARKPERDLVLAGVAPQTRALFEHRPEAYEWLDLAVNLDLFTAWERVAGAPAVRRMAYEAARDGISSYLRPVIELLLTTFEASPATLLTRADLLLRFYIRGQSLTYFPTGERAGTLHFRVAGLDPPRIFFEVWAGIILHAIEMCGARGAVAIKSVDRDGEDGVGELAIEWG
jgi:hypothetical protein